MTLTVPQPLPAGVLVRERVSCRSRDAEGLRGPGCAHQGAPGRVAAVAMFRNPCAQMICVSGLHASEQETRDALGPDRPITMAYYPDGCVGHPSAGQMDRSLRVVRLLGLTPTDAHPAAYKIRKQEAFIKSLGIPKDIDLMHMMCAFACTSLL